MMEKAESFTVREIADSVTDNVGDCCLCYRPRGRLLTVSQTLLEVVVIVTDHKVC